jgi:hypothetical protein
MRALILVVSVAGAALLSAGMARAQADRYGPDRTADQQVATLDGQYLTWPGKLAPSDGDAAQPPVPAEQAAPESPVAAPAPVAEEPAAPTVAALPAVLPAPQPDVQQPAPPPLAVAQPTPAAAPQPAARPAPPPPATAQAAPLASQQTAEDAGHARLPPHIYSVARDYGLKPDPIPLPTQFFQDQSSDTDLAAPPPALPPRPVPGAQTVNNPSSINTPSNRARAIAEDTPSPDDDSSN